MVSFAALSETLFPGNEEAAFCVLRFVMALGSVVGFALSPMLCMPEKLWILIGLIALGFAGYSAVEAMDRTKGRREQRNDQKTEDETKDAGGDSQNSSDNQRTSF